jgi:hypothetical protein
VSTVNDRDAEYAEWTLNSSVARADQKYEPSASDGAVAEPFEPIAIPEAELNVAIGSPLAVHVAFAQMRKSIWPVSPVSGSVKFAVSVGVAVVLYAALAGLTSVGVFGAVSVTLVNLNVALKLETALELSVAFARQ